MMSERQADNVDKRTEEHKLYIETMLSALQRVVKKIIKPNNNK